MACRWLSSSIWQLSGSTAKHTTLLYRRGTPRSVIYIARTHRCYLPFLLPKNGQQQQDDPARTARLRPAAAHVRPRRERHPRLLRPTVPDPARARQEQQRQHHVPARHPALALLPHPAHPEPLRHPRARRPHRPRRPPAANPFSPPASVRTFSTPAADAHPGAPAYPFPNSPGSTRASSLVDVPRAATTASGLSGLSRPTTGSSASLRPKREAFASPPARPLTIYATPSTARLRRERPKSTALLVPSAPNTVAAPALRSVLDKPWIGTRDPHARLAYMVTYGTILLGLAAGAIRCFFGWRSVLLLTDNLCPVMDEDFSSTDTDTLFGDGGLFFREVDMSGFGNGEFEMTTASNTNSYIQNGQLHLLPTLTSDVIPQASILDGAVYNITGCTYNITRGAGYTGTAGSQSANASNISPDTPFDAEAYYAACSGVSNATTGQILPPVMSARISTRRSARIRFGRVEVRAKLPTGDWLWPAIWMLPADGVYGGWPLSGEIDIMEARGNGPSYPKQCVLFLCPSLLSLGINYVRSSLNWGPATFLNAVAKTYGWWTERRGRYDDAFHTYALEWNEEFIRMYVDSRLHHMFELKLNEPFWDRGAFPTVVQNGTESVILENPWINGTRAAPFDQPFYLIMNVAVGGTNGWFPDGPEKPWLDGSATAPRDFLQAQDKWYPTWSQDVAKRAMVVDSVKMWEKC
ncbi:concanavalin A-like lectin/glucanase domain-containing protein [Mycena sp. CBHHK59/15]|nr:concanavalin A-like lectin/glucanase domain-containing protein [Mycena sp. CBHHK59/15]